MQKNAWEKPAAAQESLAKLQNIAINIQHIAI